MVHEAGNRFVGGSLDLPVRVVSRWWAGSPAERYFIKRRLWPTPGQPGRVAGRSASSAKTVRLTEGLSSARELLPDAAPQPVYQQMGPFRS
jgi:hypothetical protein